MQLLEQLNEQTSIPDSFGNEDFCLADTLMCQASDDIVDTSFLLDLSPNQT